MPYPLRNVVNLIFQNTDLQDVRHMAESLTSAVHSGF
jgi:hypothetical protein